MEAASDLAGYTAASPPVSVASDRPLRVGAAIFWAFVIFYGAWLVWRVFLPLEIDPDEAWNAWQARTAMGAGALYPGQEDLITNNYPPLSFFILGAGAKLTGLDLILFGRLAALAGLVASTGAVAALVRQFGGSRPAAGLGAAWYLATMVRTGAGYVGMNDPTHLALGLMAWALVLFVQRRRTGRSTDLAILLMVVAGFIKHSLIATPVAALAWLWLEGDYRKAARATLVGGLASAAGLAACIAAYGWVFADQLLHYKRAYSLRWGWEARQLLPMGVALACGLAAVWRRRSAGERFLLIYLVVGFVVFALGRTGDGVGVNAMFELILAIAVAAAIALDRLQSTWLDRWLSPETVKWALLAGMAAIFLHSPDPKAYRFWISPGFHRATALQIQATEAAIGNVRTLPDPVSCSTTTVCFRAGKRFVYDEFAMDERVLAGHWSEAQRQRKLVSAGIKAVGGTDVAGWD